jgi:predicted nucleotidyltransferase
MPFGLPDEVLPRLLAVLSSNPKVKQITLYGSRAKGNARHGSDIDLCLDGDALSLKDLDELDARIDDLLLPWKVDISVWQQIDNPELIAHIERVGVRVYSNCGSSPG